MILTINNIFETNILNLIVVIAIVVKVIGEAANSFLTTRKKRIIERFEEVDTEQNIADTKLKNARLALKAAEEYCRTIREQGQQALIAEKIKAYKLLERELQRIEKEHILTVQREQARRKTAVKREIRRRAFRKAKLILSFVFNELF
jgi:F-type H+-transporting ATPase subunit b